MVNSSVLLLMAETVWRLGGCAGPMGGSLLQLVYPPTPGCGCCAKKASPLFGAITSVTIRNEDCNRLHYITIYLTLLFILYCINNYFYLQKNRCSTVPTIHVLF